jgi:2-succinyl-6-hydroxy-2,4-cyclohexadiene-1-carboxylate synthase
MAAEPRFFVLLHGFAGSPATWQPVAAALEAEGAKVLCPALAGHAAEAGDAVDFISEVDRLAARISASMPGSVHVCGYSLGGRLALGLLARHANLFSGATLISANPGLPTQGAARAERMAADERWAQLAERQGVTAFAAQWNAQPLFASQRGLGVEARARQDAIRAAHDGAALASAMRALSLARMPDWRPALAGMTIPMTVMAGALDHKFVALGREMSALLRAGKLVIVPKAGHNIPLERPSAIIAALLASH